jgi:hypothetical protein
MRQIWRYLPALGAALFAPTVLFITAPNAVILLNMKEIGYDWGMVIIFLQAFVGGALLCGLVFALAQRSRRFDWLPRLLILLGVSVLLWDALNPLLDAAGKSAVGELLIEGIAFLAVAWLLFRLKLDNLYLIFGAIAPVLLVSGVVGHYMAVRAAQEAYDAARSGRVVESANAVGGATEAAAGVAGSTGWRLLRYDLDESRLALGEAADLKLYWMPPPGVEPVAAENFYRQPDGQWVQVIRQVRNLVANGGFERGNGFADFPNDLYKAPAETRQLVTETRDGQTTHVAVLKNTVQATQTSLISTPIAVNPKRLYLQAGWLRVGEGGEGYLGQVWLPTGKYGYFVRSNSPDWLHYRQIVQPPADATKVQVGAANRSSNGQVYCDDLIFVELGQVNDAACQPSTTPGEPVRCGPPLLVEAGN